MKLLIPHDIDGIEVLGFLGRGKGGYSYLVYFESNKAVLKKMHYEKCRYYEFPPNKLNAELRDYATLSKLKIPVPNLLYYNQEKQYLIKEYVDGPTCAELVARGELPDDCFRQVGRMCQTLYANDLNIDYMPHNFVWNGSRLYYVDYECNRYSEEWDFEHWGVFFWVNQSGMAKQLMTGDHRYLSREAKPLINPSLKEKAQNAIDSMKQPKKTT